MPARVEVQVLQPMTYQSTINQSCKGGGNDICNHRDHLKQGVGVAADFNQHEIA